MSYNDEYVIKLISGRIIDEYRKHSLSKDEWPYITAKKIYHQWFEFYQKQIDELKERHSNLSINLPQIIEHNTDLIDENLELKDQLYKKNEMLNRMSEAIRQWNDGDPILDEYKNSKR